MYSSYEIGGSAYAGSGNLLALRGTYGYSLILGRRWNLIPNAGLGLGLDWGDKISILPVIKLRRRINNAEHSVFPILPVGEIGFIDQIIHRLSFCG